MRFLKKSKIKKTVLVISDIHLGAGATVNGSRNTLEDFHFDKELVDFLEYYSTGDYASREVELVINGDFFDLLAVPYVHFFDDEFWSEKAALAKLNMILDAHQEVMEALVAFTNVKRKSVVYIIGNHDAELIFEALRNRVSDFFGHKDRFRFHMNPSGEYIPLKGVTIKHGHEYEIAHHFDLEHSIVEDEDGQKFFIPPWGSYYVTRVINKFKQERDYINAVRPIKKFMINGLIYDTFFTVRFGFANIFYFIMVRFIYIFKSKSSVKEVFKYMLNELKLFEDYETLTRSHFEKQPESKVLIVGHTHEPIHRTYPDGTTFINTGTWTYMHHLDFGKSSHDAILSFAQIDEEDEAGDDSHGFTTVLNRWKGRNRLPFVEI
jgi:UDP-2,3-diacylglucosamine pyrophosphatase LpxH